MAKRQSINGPRRAAREPDPERQPHRQHRDVERDRRRRTPARASCRRRWRQQVANVFATSAQRHRGRRRHGGRHHQDHVLGEGSGEAARRAERRVGEDVPRRRMRGRHGTRRRCRRQPCAGAGRLRRCSFLTRVTYGRRFRAASATMKFGVGQPIRRVEDLRLLTGKGPLPGRPDAASADLVRVRALAARARADPLDRHRGGVARAGVVAVYTGTDYANDGIAMPKAAMPRKKRDGSPMFAPQRPALVVDRVRYVGDPVAMVIAETLAQAKDAAELVVVDYEPLPSVTSVAEAAEPDAPRLWDENPDNISHTTERGNRTATEAAFAQAAHIVKRRYVDHTRACAVHGAARRARRLRSGGGSLHALRRRELSAPRAQHARQHGVQGAGEQRARGVPRRRRRLRRQGLAIRRAPAGAVGRAQARPAGEVALRTLRGDPRRRARPRQCRRRSSWRSMRMRRSSGCGCTCWPASAPISPPIGSC